MMPEMSRGLSIISPGCSIGKLSRAFPALYPLYPAVYSANRSADPHLLVRRCAPREPGRRLLFSIRNPALVDQVRMDVLDVPLAQEIVETLHPRGREHPLQYDVLERRMQTGVEFAQVGRAARPQHMAARTLFHEF